MASSSLHDRSKMYAERFRESVWKNVRYCEEEEATPITDVDCLEVTVDDSESSCNDFYEGMVEPELD